LRSIKDTDESFEDSDKHIKVNQEAHAAKEASRRDKHRISMQSTDKKLSTSVPANFNSSSIARNDAENSIVQYSGIYEKFPSQDYYKDLFVSPLPSKYLNLHQR
jgi:hypothetical protein